MKVRTFIFLIVLVTYIIPCGAANPVHPILEDGKSWIWETIDPHLSEEDMSIYNITVCGDTVVENIDCRRLCMTYVNRNNKKSYIAAYEDGGRLYVFSEDKKIFIEMLDLSLQVGDLVNDWSVIREDIVNVNGTACRRLVIGADSNEVAIWVESIGSNIDIWMVPIEMPIGVYMRMVECRLNGTVIFTNDDFNSTTSITPVINESPTDSTITYDLSGRKVEYPNPGTIYISGGKLVTK